MVAQSERNGRTNVPPPDTAHLTASGTKASMAVQSRKYRGLCPLRRKRWVTSSAGSSETAGNIWAPRVAPRHHPPGFPFFLSLLLWQRSPPIRVQLDSLHDLDTRLRTPLALPSLAPSRHSSRHRTTPHPTDFGQLALLRGNPSRLARTLSPSRRRKTSFKPTPHQRHQHSKHKQYGPGNQ
jgi:hypothetical protein